MLFQVVLNYRCLITIVKYVEKMISSDFKEKVVIYEKMFIKHTFFSVQKYKRMTYRRYISIYTIAKIYS